MDPLYLDALAALETAGGKKTIKGPKGEDSFNLYNIKDFSGKGYRARDKAEGSNDAYRVYASADESKADLIGLLSRKYPKALEAKDPLAFATALKEGGYATDPNYVAKFVSVADRLAGTTRSPQTTVPAPAQAEGAPAPSPAPERSLEALYAASQGPRPPKRMEPTKLAAAVAELSTIAPLRTVRDTEEAWLSRSQQQLDAEKATAEAEDQSLIDIARAQFMTTLGGAAMKRLARPDFAPDGLPVTEEELVGYTVEEQDAIRDGTSKAERDHIRFELDDAREQRQEAGKSGVGWAIAGGLLAGGPEAVLAGGATTFALARMGLGSMALASAGRTGAALGSLAAENVGVGLAMTAGQDYLTPDVHLQDYVIGALGDSIGMAVMAPRVFGASRSVEADALRTILDGAIEGKKADIDAARAALGPDATPAEVGKATAEAQANRIRNALEQHTNDLPEDRQLIPRDVNEQLFGDAPAEPAAKLDGPNQMDFPSLSPDPATDTGLAADLVNLPYNASGVINSNILNRRALGDVGNATESTLSLWDGGNPAGRGAIAEFERNFGVKYEQITQAAAPRAVTFVNADKLTPEMRKVALWLHKTFVPDLRIVVMDQGTLPPGKFRSAEGLSQDIGKDIAIITTRATGEWQHTLVHEFGHIIFNRGVHMVKESVRDGFTDVYNAWLKRYAGEGKPAEGLTSSMDAAIRRGPVVSDVVRSTIGVKNPDGFVASLMDVMMNVVNRTGHNGINKADANGIQRGTQYIPNIKEFSAEQFTKYIEAAVADVLDWKPSSIPTTVRKFFANLWDTFANIFNTAKQAGLIAPEEGVVQFYESIRKSAKATETKARRVADGKDPSRHEPAAWEVDSAPAGLNAMMTTPGPATRADADIIRDYGLDTLPNSTPAQQATLKAMVHLYRKAEAYPMPDEKRMSKLLAASPMQWAAPTALTLLKSKNPVARMAAAELLESGSGAGGRRTTASIAKWMHEREYMGNSVNDFQRHYKTWRNLNGGNTREDFLGGEKFEEFNRRVATELENRAVGRTQVEAQAVRDAADVLTEAYERMRTSQKRLKTPGWAALPESSDGYMPHRMSAGKVRSMTPAQGRILHSVLAEQFRTIEGFDAAFSDQLASKYIGIMRKRGTAGYSAPVGVHSAEAADIVEQSAAAMGMTADEANALAKRVLRAQPAHTRHRLKLDLNREYEADGQPFRLMDLFETDQLTLLRSQVGRVSGEAALVRHGIMGSTGMKLLRSALDFGTGEGKATNAELEAFDQVSAELLGQPFGKATGKWMDRALQFNSLASLGGIGFNQLAETLNGAVALGVRHALASVGSVKRLRSEIIALSKGQQVNNPIIGSIETYGAQIGTDHYKLIFPFDNPGRGHEVYGTETLAAGDRLLRAGSHLQGKLSLWRAITATQERGMAEQIVHKALRYIRDGQSDKALADMGIDARLSQAIRAELPNVARFDAKGRLVEFDITKLEDVDAANAFVQAVHRGTRQIIQGAFIGETGKWAHSGLLKLMTQFRTFSLIAIDKQWNRQAGNHGTGKALGILIGTMFTALPIIMVRAGIASIGREDQDAYLEKRLHPVNLARDTLNYVALSGMSGDLLDALSAVAGYEPTGGRTGTNKSFVGNVIAPAAGKVNDIWGAIQNTREGSDLHGVVKQLPFSRLPFLYPAVNSLKEE